VGSNPQDVAVRGQKLYVATLGTKGVTVLTRGSTATTVIDLSVDDPDGKPNCNSVYLVGADLYVSCELLDNTQQSLPPRGPGKVYVVDTATDTVKATLTLGHANPFGVFEQIPASAPQGGGELLIPTVLFSDGSGCVERITTGPTPSAEGCLVDNAELGGYASRIAFQIDKDVAIMWFATPTTYPMSNLLAYDLPTSALWAGAINASTQAIGDVAACPSGELVVADTTMNTNGLRIYSGSAELTTAALPIGLPPGSTRGLLCY
jgi:YVTN family beta-propeller protein